MKRFIVLLFSVAFSAVAATPPTAKPPTEAASKSSIPVVQLDLAKAESIALQQSPTIYVAQFKALAAKQVVREVRSAFFPQITAEFTGVITGSPDGDQRLGATGGLSNPTLLNRESNGILLSQLITDFGRTWNLTAASKNLALSEAQRNALTRAKVLLFVDQCYFQAQQAQALLRVADETVMARQLLADQVGALAKAQLKSELDVSYARVSLDEAKLLKLEAQNRVGSAFADLSNALGYRGPHRFALVPMPQFAPPKGNLAEFIDQALNLRPEVRSLRHEREAAGQTVAAERAAHFPKITLIGAAGRTPIGEAASTPVLGDYAAAGINVELPLFTGFLLTARTQEAALRASAVDQSLHETEDLIAKDVEVALLNTNSSADKIVVTASLLTNAEQAYDLAEAKYNIGTTSIIEFSQAQLTKLQAQINHTTATYEYQIDRLILDFQIGAPKFLQPDLVVNGRVR